MNTNTETAMNETPLRFTLLLVALALGACDGSTPSGTDAGRAPPGDDAGAMAGEDAGPSTGDDAGASLGAPPEIAVTFGACADFTPCGGDPTGTWDYTSICVEDPFAEVRDACDSVSFEDVAGTARGRVTLDGVTATRDVTLTTSATAVVGAACAIAGCAAIQSALASAVDSASCTANGSGGCDCDVVHTVRVQEASGYRVEGTQVITEDGTYDFCVSGGAMQHREVGEDRDEPGVHGLSRR